ncbi:MAG: hypothetical protein ACXVVU_25845, partial [Solirubrobacteraceae bacterium]
MPDRAVIPAVVAVSFGFLGGLAAAAFQMDTGPLIALLVAGSVATIVAGTASVAGEEREGGMVAVARS